MSIGKWLTDLIGGAPAPQMIPVRALTQAQLMQQRAQIAARTLTPERQDRIAQAFEAQAARQTIDRQLRDAGGAQNMTDVMRNMMSRR